MPRTKYFARCADCPNSIALEFATVERRSYWLGRHRYDTRHKISTWHEKPKTEGKRAA